MTQASQGDHHAIERLLQDHLPALLGYVRLHMDPVIRNHESGADIVQSVCREVIEHQEDFEYRGLPAFRAWLFTAARNKLIDRKRYILAEKRHPRKEIRVSSLSGHTQFEALYASLYSPSQAAMMKEDVERMERAFDQLSEDHQAVIHYARFLEMTHAEIASEMGRTVPAVRTLLFRAMSRLGLAMHRDETDTSEES